MLWGPLVVMKWKLEMFRRNLQWDLFWEVVSSVTAERHAGMLTGSWKLCVCVYAYVYACVYACVCAFVCVYVCVFTVDLQNKIIGRFYRKKLKF